MKQTVRPRNQRRSGRSRKRKVIMCSRNGQNVQSGKRLIQKNSKLFLMFVGSWKRMHQKNVRWQKVKLTRRRQKPSRWNGFMIRTKLLNQSMVNRWNRNVSQKLLNKKRWRRRSWAAFPSVKRRPRWIPLKPLSNGWVPWPVNRRSWKRRNLRNQKMSLTSGRRDKMRLPLLRLTSLSAFVLDRLISIALPSVLPLPVLLGLAKLNRLRFLLFIRLILKR